MSKHKMVVDLPHGPKDLGAEISCGIAFTFLAGSPASQEESGWPGELEFIDAAPLRPFDGAFADLECKWLTELAEEWFWSDEGQAAAMEEVLAEAEDARAFIAELRKERT